MKSIFLFILGSYLLCIGSSVSAQTDGVLPQNAWEALRRSFPTMTQPVQFAEGELDSDTLPDIAAIVNYTESGFVFESIVILRQIERDKYKIIGTSAGFEPHARRSVSVWIENHSLFANAGGSSNTEYWGERYQFRVRGNRFLLVGVETSRGEIGKDLPEYKMSVNLLSNTVIESHITGRRTKNVSRRLQQNHMFYLDDFTLEGIDVRGLK